MGRTESYDDKSNNDERNRKSDNWEDRYLGEVINYRSVEDTSRVTASAEDKDASSVEENMGASKAEDMNDSNLGESKNGNERVFENGKWSWRSGVHSRNILDIVEKPSILKSVGSDDSDTIESGTIDSGHDYDDRADNL